MKKTASIIGIVLWFTMLTTFVSTSDDFYRQKHAPDWAANIDTIVRETGGNRSSNGEVAPSPVRNFESYYKDNMNIEKSKLYDINKKINKDKINEEKAELQTVRLMKYKEFIEIQKLNHSIAGLSPDKLVWIVQIYYPNGLETINLSQYNDGNKKNIAIKNFLRTAIYDAETGDIIGGEDESQQ